MDLSFILAIGLSAILTAVLMVLSEITSRRISTFRLAFGISYLLGLILMQPWRVASAEEAGMAGMTMVFLAIWVVIGCVLGAIPTALCVSLFGWIAGRFKGRV